MINLCLTLADPSLAALNQKIAQYTGKVPYIEVLVDTTGSIRRNKYFCTKTPHQPDRKSDSLWMMSFIQM